MMRPNKLEGLPFETLSSRVLEFEGKASASPIGGPDASFLGKLLVLPANVRLDWKVIARYKHSRLFGLVFCDEKKSLIRFAPGGEWLRNPAPGCSRRPTQIRACRSSWRKPVLRRSCWTGTFQSIPLRFRREQGWSQCHEGPAINVTKFFYSFHYKSWDKNLKTFSNNL